MFNLSAADLDKIKRSAAEPRTQPGALRLMLRSARAGGAGARAAASSAGGASGGATADGDWQLWPAETQVQVNGNFVQVKQRRVFFQVRNVPRFGGFAASSLRAASSLSLLCHSCLCSRRMSFS